MNELWIVFKSRIDRDDYLVGSKYDKVGPFDTYRDAHDWINEAYPLIPGTGKRQRIPRGHVITCENVLSWVDSPARGLEKAGKA